MAMPPVLQKPPMAPTMRPINRAIPTMTPMVTTKPKEIITPEQAAELEMPMPVPAPVAKPIAKGTAPFDYAAYKAKSIARGPAKPKPLMLLLTGRRSGGKSYSAGTCPGDALLMCSRQEHHSEQAALASAAKIQNKNSITTIWMDLDDAGNIIDNADKVWDRVMDKLEGLINTPDVSTLFPFFFFDGLNSLERYVHKKKNVLMATQFSKSTEATATLIELIVDKFLRLREKGVHIICTMASEVKEKPDGSLSLIPMMTGYRAADEILGSFPDIGVATAIQMEDDEGAMKDTHVFQFKNAEGVKTGKKFTGETATTTFNPRLQSIPRELLPVYLEANIGNLIQFINETFESMSIRNSITEE